jgi:DNA-binding CsgD family transcriptional regulator
MGGASPAVRIQLSDREFAVALMVADGLTNAQIARRLQISSRTVATHLERVRAKLGVRSRAQLAARVVKGTA